MSQFSKCLEENILLRNLSYVQLAKRTGINRTLLHHLVRGDRKPSDTEQVQRLAEALSLSPAERRELIRLGKIAQLGEEVYQRRMAVQQMLLRISPVEELPVGQVSERLEDTLPVVCQGTAQVRALIKRVIDRECALSHGYLDFLGQPDDEFLLQLMQIASASAEMRIRHVLCFDNGPHAETINIHSFGQLLSNLLAMRGYEAYYYYGSLAGSVSGMTPFPVLLLTSTCAMQIKADYSAAIISTGSVHTLLIQSFQTALVECHPLTRRVQDLWGCLENYMPFWEKVQMGEKEAFYYLVPEYSCTAFLNPDIIETYLVQDLPDRGNLIAALTDSSKKSLKGVREYPLTQYITREGVYSFLQTGRFSDCPDEFYQPLSPFHRAYILERSIACAKESDTYQLRLYDHDSLPFSNTLILSTSAEGQVVNINCKSLTAGFVSLNLQNPTIAAAISDYLASLLDTSMVSSKEDTIRWLESALKDFRNAH